MAEFRFDKLPANPDFPAIELAILDLWERIDAFHESNRRREPSRGGRGDYVFYDGPPFATGTPHYGHLLAGTIKDIVPRYWNMRGYRVERRFGWDCHGLPIEALAQEALGLAGAAAIRDAGIDKFNEQCRSMVLTYVDEWRKTVGRMGRWIDFDNDYKTMDTDFMESVWWVFKRLWEDGRVYRAHRIMPYSWKLTTPLSNFEANSNYKDVQDPALTVRFRVIEGAPADLGDDVHLLAWTTTPWTLPSNLALCAGGDIDYVAVEDPDSGAVHVLAESRLASVYKKPDALVRRGAFKGNDLAGWRYEPLLPYFADHENSFRVLVDSFVSTEDGTGIVHMAPAYGEDDYRICREAGIALVDPLDEEARFTAPVDDLLGQHVKDADKAITKRLKDEGKLLRQDTIQHSYPFCERSDTPLIYRAIEAWYVKVEDLRDRLTAANDKIRWIPEHVGSARFGNWLRDAKDWNISRNRFWGSCLPVWVNEADSADCICVGSRAELRELSGVDVDDLHKHVLDEIVIERDGKRYCRTPEVLDCWFESGSMPYSQHHYPFEHGDELERIFPAQFIAEGLDQTRGWFYTLLVLGVSLFDRSPYENVVVNGLILAEDGQKMSKRKKNYPDPNEVVASVGADALRAYMINSPVVRGEPLRFSEKGLKEIIRTVVLPYWNALSFFTTYASVDGFDPRSNAAPPPAERAEIDRWVLSVVESLVRDVNAEMEAYRLYNVVPRLVAFIDDLTNWYVRTSRRRFWKSQDDTDKAAAYATLYDVLVTFAKVLAPFMPFLTEEVYQRLVRPVFDDAPQSVHWCDYPQPDLSMIDEGLQDRMQIVREAVALGRKLREDHRIRVRQPLSRLTVVHRDRSVRDAALAGAGRIENELNVKDVAVEADESPFTSIRVKPNFKALQRCRDKIKAIGGAVKDWSFAEVARLEAGETIDVDGEPVGLDDVILERSAKEGAAVATDGHITVVLDTTIDEALAREGIAREFTGIVQNARKQAGLEVSDRIRVRWRADGDVAKAALAEHAEAIAREVLATSFEEDAGLDAAPVDVNDEPVRFAIERS